MLDALMQTISAQNLLFMNLGVLVGIIFGALPGLSGGIAIVLFLPFTFYLDPLVSLSWLLGMYCGGTYGGSITAILIKTPGTAASAATTLDGYAMAEQGMPGKALMMALIASTFGGLFSAFCLMFFAPFISSIALKFGPPDYFSLALFGLSIIAGVSGACIWQGLCMGCVGMFVSMVGIDKMDGVYRLTFDSLYLLAGIGLIPAIIGLFALPEIINKSVNINQSFGDGQKKRLNLSEDTVTRKEMRECLPTMLRSSIIGTIIGAIPGTGAAIASFLSYNEAERRSKKPELFGKGSLEGIAASEAGNNGVTGATLIPLLTLGIPGDIVTAILTGAFLMHGIIPGPSLFQKEPVLINGIMLSMLLINIFMFLQGRWLVRLFANVTKIPLQLLFPPLYLLCVVGVFVANNSMFDVWLILAFGLFAYVADKLNLPVTPVLLGIVLGPLAESNFRRALILSEGNYLTFVTNPISLFFLILILVTVASFIRKNYLRLRKA